MNMAHLGGINKHPILDWTDENGLMEHYQKWRKKVDILFKGPINTANDAVKCNYIIYWTGQIGMELVDKWKIEGKVHGGNMNTINSYFDLFEEHIAPKSNTLTVADPGFPVGGHWPCGGGANSWGGYILKNLYVKMKESGPVGAHADSAPWIHHCLIIIVKLKRLFQGSMSLKDFHTKALRLVKEAEYPEGGTWNRILRNTLISGIASDKIHAKIIKEDKDVTLARVMEIARPEASTQRHIDRMQDMTKFNYVQYGKGSKSKNMSGKSGKLQSAVNGNSGSSGNTGNPSKSGRKGKKVQLLSDICWRCGKGRHQKGTTL